MGLKFFADHCVPNAVIYALCDAGHEVFNLKKHIPRDSPDAVVIAKAQVLNAILVSLNGDFADIITYPPSNYKGMIALQVKRSSGSNSGFNGKTNEIFVSLSRNESLSREAIGCGSSQDQG